MRLKEAYNGFIDLDDTGVWYSREYELVLAWLAEGNTPEPAKTQEEQEAEIRAVRIAEIDARLAEIDILKVRPLSELILNANSIYAREKLESLEVEATRLRVDRQSLL